MKIDVVIGANAGDEGKGTITARLASTSAKEGKRVVNILTNGGAQRGHSVALTDGNQYVFKHFGSGTPFGATTFCDETFIVNPMQFVEELGNLQRTFAFPKPLVHPKCIFTTPFDIMANLIMEDVAQKGTCGMGIWETILRYDTMPGCFSLKFFYDLNYNQQIQYLKKVRDYFEATRPIRTSKKYGEFLESWTSDTLIEHFVWDVRNMCDTMIDFWDGLEIEQKFDHVICENGQGLLLRDTGKDDADTTPSNTGYGGGCLSIVKNDLDRNLENEINLHYVTRPYITRHGAKGRDFLGKTDYKNIGIDFTFNWEINKENYGQGALEYGKLDIDLLRKRIATDSFTQAPVNPKVILEVTHNDQMQREKEFKDNFENVNFWDNPIVE